VCVCVFGHVSPVNNSGVISGGHDKEPVEGETASFFPRDTIF